MGRAVRKAISLCHEAARNSHRTNITNAAYASAEHSIAIRSHGTGQRGRSVARTALAIALFPRCEKIRLRACGEGRQVSGGGVFQETNPLEPSALLQSLGRVLREVARQELMPRWRALGVGDIKSKSSREDPEDLVTVADHAAEAALTQRLLTLLPATDVVAEEAVAADATVLNRLGGTRPVWLVDPLDGTRNFAAGEGPFGTMVALVERKVILAAGIYLPQDDELLLAERGAGTYLNGARLRATRTEGAPPMGTLYTKFMPKAVSQAVLAAAVPHTAVPQAMCAAHEYRELVLGQKDYVVYYRLLAWDHAPGALILREAGGVSRHPDGRDYDVGNEAELTLLTPGEMQWYRYRRQLFG